MVVVVVWGVWRCGCVWGLYEVSGRCVGVGNLWGMCGGGALCVGGVECGGVEVCGLYGVYVWAGVGCGGVLWREVGLWEDALGLFAIFRVKGRSLKTHAFLNVSRMISHEPWSSWGRKLPTCL